MRTRPGRVDDVCGVSVTRNSFLSYAVYPVDPAACRGGGDVACGTLAAELNSDCMDGAGAAAARGGEAAVCREVVTGESKSPRISWAMFRGAAGGAGDPVEVAADGSEEPPKISARRSCVAGTAGAPFETEVPERSSPKRSA